MVCGPGEETQPQTVVCWCYRNEFALLFDWKDGFKKKIHLSKLWTCLGEISSIKTVLKTHRPLESCHSAQTSQVISPLWILLWCKVNYEEELKGLHMYFYHTLAYFHCKCPPQSKFPILFKWVWKNIEVPSGRWANRHWIINQDINIFCSGSIFEFIIKMYANL